MNKLSSSPEHFKDIDEKAKRMPSIPPRIWWQILLLSMICLIAVFVGVTFDKHLSRLLPESQIFPSTYNDKSSGLEASLRLCRKILEPEGRKVGRWERPYRQLGDYTNRANSDLLLIISPAESIQAYEAEQILSWIAKGNQLIYFDDFHQDSYRMILDKLGIKIDLIDKKAKQEVIEIESNSSPLLSHIDSIRIPPGHQSSSARLKATPKLEVLVVDELGILIGRVRYGKGYCVIGNCPTFLSNKLIAKPEYRGNFQLLVNLAGLSGKNVLFDERCHGFLGGTNVFAHLAAGPGGLLALQILALLVVSVLSQSQRFGSIIDIERKRRLAATDYVEGLTNTYRRARANPAVAEIICDSFKNKLARSLGVSPHDPEERLVNALTSIDRNLGSELESLLSRCRRAMETGRLSEDELTKLVKSCDKISQSTKEMIIRNQETPCKIS